MTWPQSLQEYLEVTDTQQTCAMNWMRICQLQKIEEGERVGMYRANGHEKTNVVASAIKFAVSLVIRAGCA